MADQIQIALEQIEAFHPPRDMQQIDNLTADLRLHGWKGRPLLVYSTPTGYQAISGSHRIAAARRAELQSIPCVVIPEATRHKRHGSGQLTDALAQCTGSPQLFKTLYEFGATPTVVGLMALEFLKREDPDFDPEAYDFYALGKCMRKRMHKCLHSNHLLELPRLDET